MGEGVSEEDENVISARQSKGRDSAVDIEGLK